MLPNLNSGYHTVVMLDEFDACNAHANWTPKTPKTIDVFIAVEPLSWPLFAERQSNLKEQNCLIELLPTKHRTCEPIDQFISGSIREKGVLNIKSTTSEGEPVKLDFHLEERHPLLPKGIKPIWITFDILRTTEMAHLQCYLMKITKEFKQIMMISRFKRSMYTELCLRMNWNYVNIKDIIGSEVSCLITFGIPSHQNLEELVSRARNSLIVIAEEKR